MKELIEAAKAVIEIRGTLGLGLCDGDMPYIRLRAAVERAEKPPASFEDYWLTFNMSWGDEDYKDDISAVWIAAQQAERERIKEIVRDEYANRRIDFARIMERIDELNNI